MSPLISQAYVLKYAPDYTMSQGEEVVMISPSNSSTRIVDAVVPLLSPPTMVEPSRPSGSANHDVRLGK